MSKNTRNTRRRKRKTRKEKVRRERRRMLRLARETVERLALPPMRFFTMKHRSDSHYGAQTGRTSSKAPNITELARRHTLGQPLVLHADIDFSAVEMRIAKQIQMISNPRRRR